MRNIYSIFKRELLAFFVSPIAYFVITGFVLLAAYFFFTLLMQYNLMLAQYKAMAAYGMQQGGPNLNEWVVAAMYQTLMVVLVFLLPALTMRSISEEKRNGTFELLATSPIKVSEIVLGKFFGASFIVLIMLVLSFFFPLLLYFKAWPEGPEMLPMLSGLLGIWLFSMGFIAIGIAISAFSENQVISAVSSMVVFLLLYLIHAPAASMTGSAKEVFEYLSPVYQAKDFMTGVIETKSLIYFGSFILFGLFLSQRSLEAYRWR